MPKSDRPKPKKPYPDFPLFPHATGRWAKKIRGKFHYFGKWEDPDGALQKYVEQRDDLQAGRTPRTQNGGLTVREACNQFLDSKRHLVDTCELSPRTWDDYHRVCLTVRDVLGRNRVVSDLRPPDFEKLRANVAKKSGPVTLGNVIQRVRVLFKYCYDAGLIEHPVKFGPTFKKPSRRTIRHARHARGPLMFEADELRRILDASNGQLHAMILLGINCGFGQTDCSTLPTSAVNLESGWITFPRPKTAIQRRIPAWPETIAALQGVIATERKSPKSSADANLIFLTKYGHPWSRMRPVKNPKPGKPEWSSIDSVGLQFDKLLRELGLKRPRISFYAMRHTLETVAGESRDQVAVDAIMGHVDASMAGIYRERISDDRLRDVVDYVRAWLWPKPVSGGE